MHPHNSCVFNCKVLWGSSTSTVSSVTIKYLEPPVVSRQFWSVYGVFTRYRLFWCRQFHDWATCYKHRLWQISVYWQTINFVMVIQSIKIYILIMMKWRTSYGCDIKKENTNCFPLYGFISQCFLFFCFFNVYDEEYWYYLIIAKPLLTFRLVSILGDMSQLA